MMTQAPAANRLARSRLVSTKEAILDKPLPEKNTAVARDAARRGVIAEWTVTILLLLFGTTTLVQAFVIPTGSMEDSLLIGDHLLVDKLSYAPSDALGGYILPYQDVQRGDIIVFRYPIDLSQTFVKRVVGIPGDRIRIINKQLFINGKPVDEPYVAHKTGYIDAYRDNFPSPPNTQVYEPAQVMLDHHVVNDEVVVPAGNYFAMGDNRDLSLDSRYWGFVPRENIIGKPLIVYWSYDAPTERLSDSGISLAHLQDLLFNFFKKTRWSRTFSLIHPYALSVS
jgi:signal peptidase I